MQDMVEDPLARLVAGQMEQAIACGADVPELAALIIDAVLAECVAVLEVRAAQHRDERARAVIQGCADALLAAQFGGPVPTPARS
jgi:phosphoribosylformimino-5-aminoimidazole carboxamide ribonucleotide (ProFAR) isomerase